MFAGKKTSDRINAAFSELGEDVARSLRQAGCIGMRNNSTSNPVAVYLTNCLNNRFTVTVETDYTYAISRFGRLSRVYTPRNVIRFLEKFDRMAYPDLEHPDKAPV